MWQRLAFTGTDAVSAHLARPASIALLGGGPCSAGNACWQRTKLEQVLSSAVQGAADADIASQTVLQGTHRSWCHLQLAAGRVLAGMQVHAKADCSVVWHAALGSGALALN